MKGKQISNVELENLDEVSLGNKVIGHNKMALIQDVNVSLNICIGSTQLTVAELFDLKISSVLKLDSASNAPIDLLLNGKVIARGDLVVVDDSFGIHITEIMD